MMSNSRDLILSKIRDAIREPSRVPAMPEDTEVRLKEKREQITPGRPEDLVKQFEGELNALSAECIQAKSENQIVSHIFETMSQAGYEELTYTDNNMCNRLIEQIKTRKNPPETVCAGSLLYPERKHRLAGIPAALVHASYAVADIGSLVFPYDDNGSSLPHFLPDCIFAIVDKNKLVANQFELMEKLDPQKARNMVFMAGPSRTADIEKVLVLGAHGPRRLIVFMTDNQ